MYTFDQNYDSASPPAIGGGSGVSITKDPKFTFAVIDKYNRTVSSKSQYGGANNLYFDIDVTYTNRTIAPLGLIMPFNCSHIGSNGITLSHLLAVVP